MENVLETHLKIQREHIRSGSFSIAGGAILLALVALGACAIGSIPISLTDILSMLLQKIHVLQSAAAYPAGLYTIVFDIRLPRIIMAGLAGAALAVAGAAYQGMFRNPLADPYLTGISQGAALGAVVGFILPRGIPMASIPLLSFCGAALCVLSVFYIARTGKTLPMTTLILAGIAIGAFLASITSYLIIMSGDSAHTIISWLLGNLAMSDWQSVINALPYILVGITVIILMARPLNVLQLDEEQAQQLGINVEKVKLLVLAGATIATAAAVCFCGAIGFIGIIVPHAVRIVFGPNYRLLLPLSMLTGAIFLILADTAARTLIAPTEIPVGIITALVGAPFFLYLLRQRKRAIF